MTQSTFNTTAIPQELRNLRQWVVWEFDKDGNKIPKQINHHNAKVNDPSTWVSFDEAVDASENFQGIGFVITSDDPYCGVDLDNCIDDDNLRDWAIDFESALTKVGFGEVSPSGTGIKFLTNADKLEGSSNVHRFGDGKQQVEVYDGWNRKQNKPAHRWWAITGDPFDADHVTIGDGQQAIDEICKKYLIPPKRTKSEPKCEKRSHQTPPNARSEGDPTTESSKKRTRQKASVIERASKYVAQMPPAVSGSGGHNATFAVATTLVIGFDLSVDDAMVVMLEYNSRCEPPWSEYELRHKLDDADALNDERGKLLGDDGDRINSQVGRVFDQPKETSQVARVFDQGDGDVSWLGNPVHQNHNQLAVRFVNEHGVDLRFVRKWKCWVVWDVKRWRKDESGRDSLGRARRFSNRLFKMIGILARTADRDEMGRAMTFVRKANDLANMEAMLKTSSADRRVLIDHDALNQDPWLLNVQNGTIDLRDGSCRKHRQDDLITMIAPIRFDDHASCPMWIAFLDLVFDANAELIKYVQQLLGYSLVGSNDAHILPIAFGGGCNGKSTLVGVMIKLLGEYATTAMESLALGDKKEHSCEVADLYNRRFVAINEPESGDRLRESRVKMLTGDGQIKARGMKENPWEFNRTFLFWMSTNHKPRITGTDDAIWRRIKVIPFTVDIRKKTKPILDYDGYLIKNEGAGILNWLIAGCLDYRDGGFDEPECVKLAVDEYRHEEDRIAAFIEECCITSQPGFEIQASKLYEAYAKWSGKEAMTQTMFGREMAKRFNKHKSNAGSNRDKVVYEGITLAEADQDDHWQ